jgi:hypothetical protein
MSDPVSAATKDLEATPYVEGGPATTVAIDRVIAAFHAQQAEKNARASEEAVTVGGVRIAKPAPIVEPPPAPPEPVIDLGPEWAPFAADIARAQRAAEAHNFGASFYPALALLNGIQPHERVPIGATPEQRLALADAAVDALRQRWGDERAQELIAAWHEAILALGIGELLKRGGYDVVPALVEFVGNAWLTRKQA